MADILSQEEIDALLDAVDDEFIDNINKEQTQHQITLYDFKRPNVVEPEKLRAFRDTQLKMIEKISNDLSALLHSDIKLILHSVDQLTYTEFLLSLPNPTSFNTFSIKPLNGNGVFEINPSIIFPILDKLISGNIRKIDKNRELTKTEITLFRPVLKIILKGIKKSLKDFKINPKFISNDIKIPNKNNIPDSEIVVMACIEITMGTYSGMLNLCYPVISIKDILDSLAQTDNFLNDDNDMKNSLSKTILKTKVNVTKDLEIGKISIGDCKQLKVGKIFNIDNKTEVLSINNIPKYNIKNDIVISNIGRSNE